MELPKIVRTAADELGRGWERAFCERHGVETLDSIPEKLAEEMAHAFRCLDHAEWLLVEAGLPGVLGPDGVGWRLNLGGGAPVCRA